MFRQVVFHPAILSLLVAIGLISLVLVSQAAQHRKVDAYLRYTTSFFFLFTGLTITVPPFVQLYPEVLAGWNKTFSSALLQVGIYGIVVLIMMNWFRHLPQSVLLLCREKSLGIFLVYSAVSCFWSQTPLLSLRFALMFVVVTVLAVHIAREYTWRELAKLLRQLTLVTAIVSLLSAIALPSVALHEKGLQGLMPFPIKLGTFMAFGACLWLFYLVFNHPKARWRVIGIILLHLIVLVLANSAQAIFTSIVLAGLVILLRCYKTVRPKLLPAILSLYVALGVLGFVFVTTYLPLIFGAVGKDMTLTGRTDFWPQLVDLWLGHNAWFGYGINGFWQPWRGDADPAAGILILGGFAPPHAHNGFLDIGISLGLLGLGLFSLSLILTTVLAIRYLTRSRSPECVLPIFILTYVIFSNISETQLIGSSYIWILYVMVITRLHLDKQRQLA